MNKALAVFTSASSLSKSLIRRRARCSSSGSKLLTPGRRQTSKRLPFPQIERARSDFKFLDETLPSLAGDHSSTRAVTKTAEYLYAMSTSVDRGQTLTNAAQFLGSRPGGSLIGVPSGLRAGLGRRVVLARREEYGGEYKAALRRSALYLIALAVSGLLLSGACLATVVNYERARSPNYSWAARVSIPAPWD